MFKKIKNTIKQVAPEPDKQKAKALFSQLKLMGDFVTNKNLESLNIERENIKGRSSLIEKLNLYRETMKNGIKLAIGGGILVVAILALFVAYPESGEQMLSSIGIEMTGTPTQEIDKTIDQVLAAADVDFAIAETESDEEALALLDSAALSDLGGSYGEENL